MSTSNIRSPVSTSAVRSPLSASGVVSDDEGYTPSPEKPVNESRKRVADLLKKAGLIATAKPDKKKGETVEQAQARKRKELDRIQKIKKELDSHERRRQHTSLLHEQLQVAQGNVSDLRMNLEDYVNQEDDLEEEKNDTLDRERALTDELKDLRDRLPQLHRLMDDLQEKRSFATRRLENAETELKKKEDLVKEAEENLAHILSSGVRAGTVVSAVSAFSSSMSMTASSRNIHSSEGRVVTANESDEDSDQEQMQEAIEKAMRERRKERVEELWTVAAKAVKLGLITHPEKFMFGGAPTGGPMLKSPTDGGRGRYSLVSDGSTRRQSMMSPRGGAMAAHTIAELQQQVTRLKRQLASKRKKVKESEIARMAMVDRYDHLRIELTALRMILAKSDGDTVEDLEAEIRFYEKERLQLYDQLFNYKTHEMPRVRRIYIDENGQEVEYSSERALDRFRQKVAIEIEQSFASPDGRGYQQRVIERQKCEIGYLKDQLERAHNFMEKQMTKLEAVEGVALNSFDTLGRDHEEEMEQVMREAQMMQERMLSKQHEERAKFQEELKEKDSRIEELEEGVEKLRQRVHELSERKETLLEEKKKAREEVDMSHRQLEIATAVLTSEELQPFEDLLELVQSFDADQTVEQECGSLISRYREEWRLPATELISYVLAASQEMILNLMGTMKPLCKEYTRRTNDSVKLSMNLVNRVKEIHVNVRKFGRRIAGTMASLNEKTGFGGGPGRTTTTASVQTLGARGINSLSSFRRSISITEDEPVESLDKVVQTPLTMVNFHTNSVKVQATAIMRDAWAEAGSIASASGVIGGTSQSFGDADKLQRMETTLKAQMVEAREQFKEAQILTRAKRKELRRQIHERERMERQWMEMEDRQLVVDQMAAELLRVKQVKRNMKNKFAGPEAPQMTDRVLQTEDVVIVGDAFGEDPFAEIVGGYNLDATLGSRSTRSVSITGAPDEMETSMSKRGTKKKKTIGSRKGSGGNMSASVRSKAGASMRGTPKKGGGGTKKGGGAATSPSNRQTSGRALEPLSIQEEASEWYDDDDVSEGATTPARRRDGSESEGNSEGTVEYGSQSSKPPSALPSNATTPQLRHASQPNSGRTSMSHGPGASKRGSVSFIGADELGNPSLENSTTRASIIHAACTSTEDLLFHASVETQTAPEDFQGSETAEGLADAVRAGELSIRSTAAIDGTENSMDGTTGNLRPHSSSGSPGRDRPLGIVPAQTNSSTGSEAATAASTPGIDQATGMSMHQSPSVHSVGAGSAGIRSLDGSVKMAGTVGDGNTPEMRDTASSPIGPRSPNANIAGEHSTGSTATPTGDGVDRSPLVEGLALPHGSFVHKNAVSTETATAMVITASIGTSATPASAAAGTGTSVQPTGTTAAQVSTAAAITETSNDAVQSRGSLTAQLVRFVPEMRTVGTQVQSQSTATKEQRTAMTSESAPGSRRGSQTRTTGSSPGSKPSSASKRTSSAAKLKVADKGTSPLQLDLEVEETRPATLTTAPADATAMVQLPSFIPVSTLQDAVAEMIYRSEPFNKGASAKDTPRDENSSGSQRPLSLPLDSLASAPTEAINVPELMTKSRPSVVTIGGEEIADSKTPRSGRSTPRSPRPDVEPMSTIADLMAYARTRSKSDALLKSPRDGATPQSGRSPRRSVVDTEIVEFIEQRAKLVEAEYRIKEESLKRQVSTTRRELSDAKVLIAQIARGGGAGKEGEVGGAAPASALKAATDQIQMLEEQVREVQGMNEKLRKQAKAAGAPSGTDGLDWRQGVALAKAREFQKGQADKTAEQVKELTREIRNLRVENGQLNSRVRDQEDALHKVDEGKALLQIAKDKDKVEVTIQITKLKGEVSDLQLRNKTLKADNVRMKDSSADHDKEIEHLKKAEERKVSQLQAMVAAYEKDHKDLRDQILKLEAKRKYFEAHAARDVMDRMRDEAKQTAVQSGKELASERKRVNELLQKSSKAERDAARLHEEREIEKIRLQELERAENENVEALTGKERFAQQRVLRVHDQLMECATLLKNTLRLVTFSVSEPQRINEAKVYFADEQYTGYNADKVHKVSQIVLEVAASDCVMIKKLMDAVKEYGSKTAEREGRRKERLRKRRFYDESDESGHEDGSESPQQAHRMQDISASLSASLRDKELRAHFVKTGEMSSMPHTPGDMTPTAPGEAHHFPDLVSGKKSRHLNDHDHMDHSDEGYSSGEGRRVERVRYVPSAEAIADSMRKKQRDDTKFSEFLKIRGTSPPRERVQSPDSLDRITAVLEALPDRPATTIPSLRTKIEGDMLIDPHVRPPSGNSQPKRLINDGMPKRVGSSQRPLLGRHRQIINERNSGRLQRLPTPTLGKRPASK